MKKEDEMCTLRWLLCACVLAAGGCHVQWDGNRPVMTGELVRESRTIARADAAKAEVVRVELTMAAGEMVVSGGAKELLEGTFEYNAPDWKPQVEYVATGFRGRLTVHQGKAGGTLGDVKNEWNLRLANDIPMDLVVRCGAGENRLDIGDLDLRSVEVHMGAGAVHMDLRGKQTHDFEVAIHGGVGEARIKVPNDVGVYAEAKGAIGSINVRGMKREGKGWANEAYGKSKTTIRLDVKGGIGEINISAE
jgi:hypothetical protein